MVAAHPMHAAARRSRRRAQIQVPRSGVVVPQRRPEEELPHRQLAATMSPPIRFASIASSAAGDHTRRSSTQSLNPGANRSTCASMWFVISAVHACGTWQYIHATCLPSGARVASNSDGCATSTNGFSATAPCVAACSERAISSRVPPRCTVIARKHSRAFHGMGAESA